MAFEPSIFEQQRRNIFAQYTQQAALNAYQKYLAETRAQQPITQLSEAAFGFTPTGGLGEVPRLTSSYARRGLTGQNMRSGVYQNALDAYTKNRAREMGSAQRGLTDITRGYNMTADNLLSNQQNQLLDLEGVKSRQIAEDAQALLRLR